MSLPSLAVIARGLAILQKGSRQAQPQSLALVDRLGGLKRLEKIADANEARRASKAIASVGDEVKAFDIADAAIRMGMHVDDPSIQVLRAISAGRSLRGSTFAASLSQKDKLTILSELFARIRSQSRRAIEDVVAMANPKVRGGYVISCAGMMREVHGRSLKPIAVEVLKLRHEFSKLRRTTANLEVIDSNLIGAVRTPTRWRAGERSLALGTDRIVGLGQRLPTMIRQMLEDGTEATFRIEGELELRIAVEVKGRTTATDGIRQFVALQRRGNQGYVQIGEEFWLVKKYRADQVEHFLVAPAGEDMRLAAKEADQLRALGIRITPVEISAQQEQEIKKAADMLVGDIANHALSRATRAP